MNGYSMKRQDTVASQKRGPSARTQAGIAAAQTGLEEAYQVLSHAQRYARGEAAQRFKCLVRVRRVGPAQLHSECRGTIRGPPIQIRRGDRGDIPQARRDLVPISRARRAV